MIEIVLILILILANGFFSCVEIAVIAARKGNIKALAEQGDRNATLLTQLHNNPERFLSTVQIGVTLFGSAAAALGGVSAVEFVRPWVQDIPYLGAVSQFVAVSAVVLVISYLSLIVGELVPKALALKYPDTIALIAAKPFHLLAQTLRPFVNFLTLTVLFFLKPFGGKIVPRSTPSEEEIKWLLKEGREKGEFDETEHEMIQSVFGFTDISVKEAMVPWPKVHSLSIDAKKDEVIRFFIEEKFSRCPVYKNNPNDIVGILLFKDLIKVFADDGPFNLSHFVKAAYFVPETMKVSLLLKEFQRRRTQMAIVVNEYGSVEGLVTMEDLVEEIVGEIHDETDGDEEKPVERLKDGSWVIDASMGVRELRSDHDLLIPESPDYETIGGFVLDQMQVLPKGGEFIQSGEYKLTVVDMDGRRINKVKVEKKTEVVPTIA
jgi:putative hemolysin